MPRKVKLKVGCTLFLSNPSVVFSTRPTPVATYDTVPYGVAQLRVLVLCDDLIDATVEVLQANLSEIHLQIQLVVPASTLDMVSSFCPHSL